MIHLNRKPLSGKRLQMMATCLCDAFFADVAQATVEVLEYLGCEIEFPGDQTCCGQPAFNGGDWKSSRQVVRHTLKVFKGSLPVVVPSGSCAAMVFHGALLAFENEPDLPEVRDLASRTWELTDFIVNGLGVTRWPGTYPAKVAFHRSCHTRGTPSGETTRLLLGSIEGLHLLDFAEGEQCCGFGGTFSVSFPNISEGMGKTKLGHISAVSPDEIVSGDMGCLMHLGGLDHRAGGSFRMRHVAQILRDSLHQAGHPPVPSATTSP